MKTDDMVAWEWGTGIGEGMVLKVCPDRTEMVSKGKTIVRNGTPDNPALIIKHTSGTLVLKLQSEVQKAA